MNLSLSSFHKQLRNGCAGTIHHGCSWVFVATIGEDSKVGPLLREFGNLLGRRYVKWIISFVYEKCAKVCPKWCQTLVNHRHTHTLSSAKNHAHDFGCLQTYLYGHGWAICFLAVGKPAAVNKIGNNCESAFNNLFVQVLTITITMSNDEWYIYIWHMSKW